MGGIACQGDAWNALPLVVDRQGVDEPHDRCRVAIGDQGTQWRSPTLELVGEPTHGARCAEIDGADPRFRLVQSDVAVQGAIRITVRQDALARLHRHQRAAANGLGTGFVLRIAIEENDLDESRANVHGPCLGQQRAHSRPSPVRADQQVRCGGRAVCEGKPVLPASEAGRPCELGAPSDGADRKRLDQQSPQGPPVDLGPGRIL